MKLLFLAIIGLLVISYILDKQPPIPTENGIEIKKEITSKEHIINKNQSKEAEQIINIFKGINPLKIPKVWTYIEIPNDNKSIQLYHNYKNIPILYQACIDKMKENTNDLIVLTPENIPKYFPKFPIIMNHKSRIPLKKRIDILFAFVLYEYGGLCISPGTIIYKTKDIIKKLGTYELVSFGSSPRIMQGLDNPQNPNTYVIGSRKMTPFISEYKRLLLLSIKDNFRYNLKNKESYDIMSELLKKNNVEQFHFGPKYDGTYNLNMKLIDLSEYLGTQKIQFLSPKDVLLISIPYDELEKQKKYHWFLNLSKEQFNLSKVEVVRLLNRVSLI